MMADAEAVNGRKNFIIIVLKEKMQINKLPKELKTHMKTYTYIDATKNTDKLMKRLRLILFCPISWCTETLKITAAYYNLQ